MINNFDPEVVRGRGGAGKGLAKGCRAPGEMGEAGSVEDMKEVQGRNNIEEEIDDNLGDDSVRVTLGETTFQWPKQFPQGWPVCASSASIKLEIPNFADAVFKYFHKQYGLDIDEHPIVSVIPSISMSYPSWVEDEVLTSNSGPPNESPVLWEYLLPSVNKVTKRRINANDFRRHDTILVRVPLSHRN